MPFSGCRLTAYAAAAVSLSAGVNANAATPALITLVSFNGQNGQSPVGGLIFDKRGDLYGTTEFGGKNISQSNRGDGTVFELSGAEHKNFSTAVFFDGANGSNSTATLTSDSADNLYGVTATGGDTGAGGGTAFRLSGAGHTTLTTLAIFTGPNGVNPVAALSFDPTGKTVSLFGATNGGGPNSNGTIFRLSGTKFETLTTVDAIGGNIGETQGVTVIGGSSGKLFSTMASGGSSGFGIVVKLSGRDHATSTVLATFNGSNGAFPISPVTFGPHGDLFGTTSTGGPNGDGTVFKLSGPGHTTLTTLAAFANSGPNGAAPLGAVLVDQAGNIFGTTSSGGAGGGGTVFRIAANKHTFTLLHSFSGSDGAAPSASLVADRAGNIYGTTTSGGASNDGTVFELTGTGFISSR